jgi:hypothetical protein
LAVFARAGCFNIVVLLLLLVRPIDFGDFDFGSAPISGDFGRLS